MAYDIRNIKNITDLIGYFSQNLGWDIDLDDFDDIEDISYDFDAEDIGLKEESFAKISSLRQLQPLVDGQQWGIFCVEFDSNKFEPSALKKILSGLIPRKRNSADHAVWCQQDLLFICNWGTDNNSTIGLAHFEDRKGGLPQIKMFSCAPALEDFTQIKQFEKRLSQLAWPKNTSNIDAWRETWSSAFTTAYKQTIQDSSTLTVQLAAEAQNIRNRLLDILEVETSNGYVHLLFEKFRNTLIHDMTEQQFADMYAQTVVYGLFSARCMDKTQEDFSAEEAVELIPNTNPFLKSLMQECLGAENTSKLSFDELEIGNVVDLLLHTKTDAIIQDFNRQTGGGREDPVIHFYEEFLTAYDKAQKVQRGVYYTPQPVVNFIVRAVDDILKKDFNYKDGLASTDTKKIKVLRQSKKRTDGFYRTMVEDTEIVPAVQILDPATGTGTFLRQTILQIYHNFLEANKRLSPSSISSAWNQYVNESLLPRLNGFELMMAPYAVAHMKLAMVLRDTGYDFSGNSRLNVFLTNSLEEPGHSDHQMSLFQDPLALESVEANSAKKNKGICVVLGNPPYSSSSSNRGEWIMELLSEYKEGVKEKKLNLDDDYIKFIRYGQYVLEQSGNGILAYISNNSFIDGNGHREMRHKLMQLCNEIYIINLHGNSKKKETAPDGGKDENVFDIQQGVSINIFVSKKASSSSEKCRVYSLDLYGDRMSKYNTLAEGRIHNLDFVELTPQAPSYFFVPKDFSNMNKYNKGFGIDEIFKSYNSGIQTKCDSITVNFQQSILEENIEFFRMHTPEEIETHFNRKSNSGWSAEKAKKDVETNPSLGIRPYLYRPFDVRNIIYSNTSGGILGRPRAATMDHMRNGNIALITVHFQSTFPFQHALVTDLLSDLNSISMQTGEQSFVFPLYVTNDEFGKVVNSPNLDDAICKKIAESINRKYTRAEKLNDDEITAFEIFSYIYAILFSKKYRERYVELLKINFPRIPYPRSKKEFDALVKLGQDLIDLHLLKTKVDVLSVQEEIIDPVVSKITYDSGMVKINKKSHFSGVSESVWNEYFGGYQPLQKWLKERKKRALSEEDIAHFKKMCGIIEKTQSLMQVIDSVVNL